MDEVVSSQWLARHLDDRDIVVVDASWFMPSAGRDAEAEFVAGHIPGALRFDIDALSDPDPKAPPHSLPSADAFGSAMSALGIGRDDRIIAYDNSPVRSAARAWWMLRHFGAGKVAILDGGLAGWRAGGHPLEQGPPRPRPRARFDAVERHDVVTKQALLGGQSAPLLDARSAARFEGREDDPRPGVAAGHIPCARNLPFTHLYREDGSLRGEAELAAAFAAAGVDPRQPFVASCGSGVTAASLLLAARRLGGRDALLYDGSWSEWGSDPATPKALGPA
jgi:thiosulfate/3-mercaptopyruvate sulfurtransferase